MQLDNTEETEEGKRGGRYEFCPFWRTLEKYAAERVKDKRGRFYLIDSDGWFC